MTTKYTTEEVKQLYSIAVDQGGGTRWNPTKR